jgi:hypothetical protein
MVVSIYIASPSDLAHGHAQFVNAEIYVVCIVASLHLNLNFLKLTLNLKQFTPRAGLSHIFWVYQRGHEP